MGTSKKNVNFRKMTLRRKNSAKGCLREPRWKVFPTNTHPQKFINMFEGHLEIATCGPKMARTLGPHRCTPQVEVQRADLQVHARYFQMQNSGQHQDRLPAALSSKPSLISTVVAKHATIQFASISWRKLGRKQNKHCQLQNANAAHGAEMHLLFGILTRHQCRLKVLHAVLCLPDWSFIKPNKIFSRLSVKSHSLTSVATIPKILAPGPFQTVQLTQCSGFFETLASTTRPFLRRNFS